MLEISKFSWSNFLSFDDNVSTVDLSELKECLIVGAIEDDNGNIIPGKSNGAGKSNIIAALQWTLFGKTVHDTNPGGKIRHFFNKEDTWGKVTLENGDSIIRTRKYDGTTEVVFYHSGQEQCISADTLSTLKAQQMALSQAFNLDWDMFSKSVFFSCFDKPWMQISDQKRKEVLEKLLKLDRLAYYAKSATARTNIDSTELQRQKDAIQARLRFLSDLRTQTETQKSAIEQFESNRQARLAAKENQKREAEATIAAITAHDLSAIESEWNEYTIIKNKIEIKLRELKEKRGQILNNYNYSKRRVSDLQNEIRLLESKIGTICLSCGQTVADGHIHDLANPKEAEKETIAKTTPILSNQLDAIDQVIKSAEQTIENNKPKSDLNVAKSEIEYRNNLKNRISVIIAEMEAISREIPPNAVAMDNIRDSLIRIKNEIKEFTSKSDELEQRLIHLEYIRKAYSDRNKIKKDIVAEHVPFINERLRYYLDIFELEVKIQLTDSLGVESNYWGYSFQSNGEKRRTDVAMMLATFDFHEQLYGRQCNILVLDEVDGQMDEQGIDSLIHIIKNDLTNRAGNVFIISHMNTMQNVFGSEIRVIKRGKTSRLGQ